VGCLLAAQAQLGNAGYGYGAKQQACVPNTRTEYVSRTQVQTRYQPFSQFVTRTQQAVRNEVATVAVTSTVQRVEQRQVTVPVIRTFQSTVFSTRVDFQQVPYQPPPVTRTAFAQREQVQTRVNNRVVSVTSTNVQNVVVTNTQYVTRTVQSTNVQVVTRTNQVRGQDVIRTQTREDVRVQTQFVTPRPVQRVITSTAINQVQSTRVQQAPAFTRYQTVNRDNVRTQVQNVQQTRQVVRTVNRQRTIEVPAIRTVVRNENREVLRTQNVVRTQVINSEVVRTNFVPQVQYSTQFVDRANTQFVTQTRVQTQFVQSTVRGAPRVQEIVQTVRRDVVRTVTRNVQRAPQVVIKTRTIPCQQRQQKGGHGYSKPRSYNRYG